jgi:hypothetical protein
MRPRSRTAGPARGEKALRDEPGGALSKERCAQRAVTLLRQAVAKEWKHAEFMKTDDDLKALRRRDDFKKLLAELEKKAP